MFTNSSSKATLVSWCMSGCNNKNQPPSDLRLSGFLFFFLDSDTEFCWTEDEVADLYNNTSFIIAADGRLLN